MPKPITGGCLCGAVRYEADQPPNEVYACHCRYCQRYTGSAFWAGAKFPEGALRFIAGAPSSHRATPLLERYFCTDCGSSIGLRYIKAPWPEYEPGMEVGLGSLDDPTAFEPAYHFCVESKLAWPQFDKAIPLLRGDEDEGLASAFDEASQADN
ncbi:MAG: GFA family protein [Pseudomonadota bacterium]